MAMQGFAPQGPDALTLLMQAQQQKQDSNPLASIAATAAPFILKGLGGKTPTPAAPAGGMTPAAAPLMSAAPDATAPIMQGLGGQVGPRIPSSMVMTPGLQEWLAQNQGAFIR